LFDGFRLFAALRTSAVQSNVPGRDREFAYKYIVQDGLGPTQASWAVADDHGSIAAATEARPYGFPALVVARTRGNLQPPERAPGEVDCFTCHSGSYARVVTAYVVCVHVP
jgi:hypothetical protein